MQTKEQPIETVEKLEITLHDIAALIVAGCRFTNLARYLLAVNNEPS